MQSSQLDLHWARRVPPEKIQRLYEGESRGILDEDLLDEAGYALLARCKDILEVSDAVSGRVHCRQCGSILARTCFNGPDEEGEILHCGNCAWEINWGAFFKSFTGRKLRGGEVVRVYQQFIDDWQRAKSTPEKMLAIDRLIHEFHTNLGKPTKPVAVTVIGGSSTRVKQLIEDLAFKTRST
jgi:hypothetical protein